MYMNGKTANSTKIYLQTHTYFPHFLSFVCKRSENVRNRSQTIFHTILHWIYQTLVYRSRSKIMATFFKISGTADNGIDNGSTCDGQRKDGQPNGQGTITFTDQGINCFFVQNEWVVAFINAFLYGGEYTQKIFQKALFECEQLRFAFSKPDEKRRGWVDCSVSEIVFEKMPPICDFDGVCPGANPGAWWLETDPYRQHIPQRVYYEDMCKAPYYETMVNTILPMLDETHALVSVRRGDIACFGYWPLRRLWEASWCGARVAVWDRDMSSFSKTLCVGLPTHIQYHMGLSMVLDLPYRHHNTRIATPTGLLGPMGPVVFNALASALTANHTLTALNVRGNDIGDKGCIALANALEENHTLTALNVRGNDIGDKGCIALANALEENHTLEVLIVRGNGIGGNGCTAIAKALTTNRALTTLDLGNNHLGECKLDRDGVPLIGVLNKGYLALVDALKVNHALKVLNIRGNGIGGEGCIALADALTTNRAAFGVAFTTTLKANYTLITLNMLYNRIGDEGCIALAEALKANYTLITLNMGYNRIGDKGCAALAAMLKENHTLTTLNLRGNSIGEFELCRPIKKGCIALAEALKANYTLKALNVQENNIRFIGCTAFAAMMKENHTLTALNVRGNMIGDEGCSALANALKENHTLTVFLENNDIGESGRISLADALAANRACIVYYTESEGD